MLNRARSRITVPLWYEVHIEVVLGDVEALSLRVGQLEGTEDVPSLVTHNVKECIDLAFFRLRAKFRSIAEALKMLFPILAIHPETRTKTAPAVAP